DHDLRVVGSHHVFGAGRTFGIATGLWLSVSSPVPRVVVPTDWRPENAGRGIAVGIGPDESAANAIAFGVQRALALGEPLKLISGWGLPAFLSRPAEMMGGGIAPVGEQFQNTLNEIVSNLKAANPDLVVSGKAEESTSPARAILESSRHSNMLVLGTHSYGTFGRALFGSTTNSVLGNLLVPTVIVPMK
ncbi:MAG: universal stress protein, partial [Coriobacteriia bacterium]|nr:universal stress protein [Coriobacteriia bacterium]